MANLQEHTGLSIDESEVRRDLVRPAAETTQDENEQLARLAFAGLVESRRNGSKVRIQEQYEKWLRLGDS